MSDVSLTRDLFEHSNGKLISVEQITAVRNNGTTMHSYTERIANVRSDWKCSCGDDPKYCTAEKHIVNIKPGWFQFRSTKLKQESQEEIPTLEINKPDYGMQYLELREEYKNEKDTFKHQKFIQDVAENLL